MSDKHISDVEPKVYSYEYLNSVSSVESSHPSMLITFSGVDDNAVYNPCPFIRDGKLCILGRVEPTSSEVSHVYLFEKKNTNSLWAPGQFQLENTQDPFVTCINGNILVGGVELSVQKLFSGLFQISGYRTVFWDFESKQKLAQGPEEMKDIRLIEIDNKIGVFTRPRSEDEGKVVSSINFGITDSLTNINAEYISSVSKDPLAMIKGFFNQNEWGGVNSVYMLEDDWIGVLGHIAYYAHGDEKVDKVRKYAAMAFEFNPQNSAITHPKIILSRQHLSFDVKAKRDDLHDVIFPGGLIFLSKNDESLIENILFFYGLGDAYVGVSELAYPFSKKLDLNHQNNKLFILPETEAANYTQFF